MSKFQYVMAFLILLAGAFLLMALSNTPAAGQTVPRKNCETIEDISNGLAKYGEKLLYVGTVNMSGDPEAVHDITDPVVILTFANPDTGTFTNVIYNTKTSYCTVFTGVGFMGLTPEKGDAL